MVKPRSILIVRLSAIGDVIHTLPVLDALRCNFPKTRIGWLVEELSAPLLEGHEQLDCIYKVPKKRWRGRYAKVMRSEVVPFFKEIRRDRWDVALDLQGISKSGIASWASGAKLRIGFKGENSREIDRLFCNRRIHPHKDATHVVEQNMALLSGLGIRPGGKLPLGKLSIHEDERAVMAGRLGEAGWRGEPLLLVNPGAGFPSKKYPPESYAKLAGKLSRRLGYRPLVLWGPGEEGDRDTILSALHEFDPISAPPTTVREMAVLIAHGSLFLGGDTGPSQLAGPLSVPVISIFGGTEWPRNAPWTGGRPEYGVSIQRTDLGCVPCWERNCPLVGAGHMSCMTGLDPAEAFERLEPWLDTLPRPTVIR